MILQSMPTQHFEQARRLSTFSEGSDMKFDLSTLEDLEVLSETVSLECKLAHGEDGKGAVPKDFWRTYSAMANARGGIVLFGIREQLGKFTVAGLDDIGRVRRDLFNNLNNPGKVSANLLVDSDVEEILIDGRAVLAIHIPQAPRKQKPVFLNGQPLGNTWRRLNDGDRQCDDEAVKRMLAEQIEDERDRRVLPNYGLTDLDKESVRIYRQMLRDESPAHPWLELEDMSFLQQLGAWRRDRETAVEGLTLAGLLMFGRWSSIQEAVPHYFVDYQERAEARTEKRWIDRLVPDGTWSGNVFDFYRRVYRKLVTDLKVPFALKDGQRQDDTPVHEALREALVNALVHADYTGRVSILIVKRPDMFGFRNPGELRLPLEQVLQGGESDCRNRLMHQMFLMIGLGERAGSGMPKIMSGWRSQHWRQPLLREKSDPGQTLLELHMLDLLPDSVVQQLRTRFGSAFDALDHGERLIMATATIEQVVNHARLIEILDLHPHDLSMKLARLERDGLLQSSGQSRGKIYYLPGDRPLSPEDVFPSPVLDAMSPPLLMEFTSGGKTFRFIHSASSSVPNATSSVHNDVFDRDKEGCLLTQRLDAPVVDDLKTITSTLKEELELRAAVPRTKPRLRPMEMEQAILSVCTGRYVRLNVLAELVNRNPDALRRNYMDKLVKGQQMLRAFPTKPNHEMQSYRTKE
jgi:ATP-dependent DNA helicase RecG